MISENIRKINWKHAVLCILLLVSSSIFYYGDANSTIRQGINVWHALFSGKIFSYYTEYGAAYGMIMIVLMGIWQFPLFLVEKIVGINVLDFFIFRVYGKMQLIIIAWVAATYLKKLALRLGFSAKKAEYAFIMYLTSIPIMTSICQVGQVDIFGMALTIMAYYYLFSSEKKWKFYICFILAVQCKYVAWFILVPVIFFLQKKIWKIIMIVATPLIISFIINIPFSQQSLNVNEGEVSGEIIEEVVVENDIMYAEASDVDSGIDAIDETGEESVIEGSAMYIEIVDDEMPAIEADEASKENIGVGNIIGAGTSDNSIVSVEFYNFLSRPVDLIDSNFKIPLLFLVYVSICAVAFLKDPKDDNKYWWCLYLGFLGAVSVITCLQLPYRMGYILFFTTLFVLKQEHNFTRKLTLEIIAYASLIMGHFASYAWLYDLSNMRNMLIDNILPLRKFALSGIENIRQMVLTNHMESLWSIFFAIFLVWILVLLWMSYPDKKYGNDSGEAIEDNKESNRLLLVRSVVNLLLCNFAVVLYVIGVIKNIYIHFFG